MRRLLVGLVASTGCNSILGIEELADSEVCLGAIRLCAEPVAGPIRLESETIDTDKDFRCETRTQVSGPDLCLISARTIEVVGMVPVVGSRPLALFASDAITVASGAILDVSSKRGVQLGGGADSLFCDLATEPVVGSQASGGGAGGSFGTKGGNGGTGGGGGTGAMAGSLIPPSTVLRGGCAGTVGGAFAMSGNAPAGDPGGAVYLLAKKRIAIQTGSYVRASGAGGTGSTMKGGGGGGGSGGMIALDAADLVIEGDLVAHGGGGGEGSAAMIPGGNGEDGATDYDDRGEGGTGGPSNCDGGPGSNRNVSGGANGDSGGTSGGGGGGGGGAGLILLRGTTTGATRVTPTPQ